MMPDIPEAAVGAALAADFTAAYEHSTPERPFDGERLIRIILEAAAPELAEHVARKILAHMEAHGPLDVFEGSLGGTLRRAWRRHFGIAARIAAGAFSTDEDMRRQAAEALNRGDFAACWLDEGGNPVAGTREDGERD